MNENENNNINNDINNQPPQQDASQESTMYHYDTQGAGQEQTSQEVGGGYTYADPADQNTEQGAYDAAASGSGEQFSGEQNYNNGTQNTYTNYNTQTPEQAPGHSKAVASLVLGIIGLVCCGICSIIALVMAIGAKKEGNEEGIQTAGLVMGIIGCALWAVGIVLVIVNGTLVATFY